MGGGIVTRRHVRSQQEWHCLPRWEPTVKDRCQSQKGTPPAAKAATKLYQLNTTCTGVPIEHPIIYIYQAGGWIYTRPVDQSSLSSLSNTVEHCTRAH
jgi:hypothetical protein